MKKVLLVGEHPHGISGNSHMLKEIIEQIDTDKYQFAVFACTSIGYPVLSEYMILEGGGNPNDEYGGIQLVNFLDNNKFDIVCFVGLDIWRYTKIYPHLIALKNKDHFIWISIFPYDAINIREDWLPLFTPIDFPCVYSEYGYNLLKDRIPSLTYFRPPFKNHLSKFTPFSPEKRRDIRQKLYQKHGLDDNFIFGFFGNNQIRKDPLRVIKAFFEVKKEFPNCSLYLHTNLNQGVYNIEQHIRDCGGKLGDILIKKQNINYTVESMVEVYNSVDCYVLPSLQEGLSITMLEAMSCGIPVIASYTTAHKELIWGGVGIGVPMTELAYLPVLMSNGSPTFVESRACEYSFLVNAMKSVVNKRDNNDLIDFGLKKVKQWASKVSNINDVLGKEIKYAPVKGKDKINKILFAQHSSAGDVFMTTRCLKDIKKRHKDPPLVYMTQKKYQNIVEGNPYIDEIIDWDDSALKDYKVVYNPHGDRILPGHWGRNSNSILSDFYWKVLMIDKPDDFYIGKKKPSSGIGKFIEELNTPICILHTTGGDPSYRTYKYMKDVHTGLIDDYFTIQVGSKNDYPAGAGLDLRGKLSFQETAWVVSKAKVAVTVDSFVSHLCGALGVSQVCLFGSGNHNVVKPLQVKGSLICKTVNFVSRCKGLGPCSAGVRDCPIHCTGIHSPDSILKDIKYIEDKQFSSFEEVRISG